MLLTFYCKDNKKYLCEGVTLLGSALGLAGWVAEREDDWALVERGHVSDDLLGEGAGHRSHSWEAKQRRTTRTFSEDYLLPSRFRSANFPHRKRKWMEDDKSTSVLQYIII